MLGAVTISGGKIRMYKSVQFLPTISSPLIKGFKIGNNYFCRLPVMMDSASATRAQHCCCIIPVPMLKAIANSEAASAQSRAVATKTISHIANIRQSRTEAQERFAAGEAHQRTHGIVPKYVYQAIFDSDEASPQSKERAQSHLATLGAIKDAKSLLATSKTGTTASKLFRVLYDSHQTDDKQDDQYKLFVENKVPDNADPAAKRVYDDFGRTFNFYNEVLKRNSIDDKGMSLIGCVHFDEDNGKTPGYDNAFWDGTEMCFGDGDPQIFNSFTSSTDITGHELTHGVTAYTANLKYEYQSGALNESMSDVFGSLVKQYSLQQKAKDADWLIGAGIFRDSEGARALRDMANPGTAYKNNKYIGSDPQPKDMDGYVHLPNTDDGDSGGVHTNSGIPNRAFFLAATSIGEYAWDPAGKIWYAALTDPNLRKSNSSTKTAFKVFANLTIKHAQDFGGAPSVAAVTQAWKTVKVL
jgi:Zn-dependent metalloprotease